MPLMKWSHFIVLAALISGILGLYFLGACSPCLRGPAVVEEKAGIAFQCSQVAPPGKNPAHAGKVPAPRTTALDRVGIQKNIILSVFRIGMVGIRGVKIGIVIQGAG